MSAEDWGFEWEERFSEVLIVDLGAQAIRGVGDVYRLGDEVESIHEDYPEYKMIIFKTLNGTP